MLNLSNVSNANVNEINVLTKSVDLEAPGVASQIAKRIKVEIDDYCAETYDDGHRNHLGASMIGHDCNRYLWYIFRWAFKEKFDGRQQRLFNRGHREEDRFVEWLRGIGCEVSTHDETQPKNSKGEYPQHRVSGVMGHFGGSLDAIIKLPPRYGILKPVLGEFKTSGTGSKFTDTRDKGMIIKKPQHYAQTSLYGYKRDFSHVLYNIINKNDDDLHIELTKLNHDLGRQLEAKAERIIMSQTPPARLSDNPTFFGCKFCAMADMCHRGAQPEKNCRSCKFAVPIENAQWGCNAHNQIIPPDFIPKGCDKWQPITE